jgi:transcriptional repressor NrdR
MVCIQCGFDTRVTNSRLQKRQNQVWRRRSCPACGLTFTTEESIRYDGTWVVQSTNKQLATFSRDKLFLSIYKSCAHRKTAVADASGLANTVIQQLAAQVADARLEATAIRTVVEVVLARFDKTAASHYTAYHRA